MIGIVVVTHGSLAKSIVESAELIMGKQNNVVALGLEHGDSVELLKDEVKNSIIKMDKGKGVLVFVDILGGSPSNVALRNMIDLNFKCITGLSMPMLIEAFASREGCSLEELADNCTEAGRTGIRELHKEIENYTRRSSDGRNCSNKD
ncbi:MAG: PTS sugar transporter subunit IIA [Bacillota bacterium]